MAKAVASPLRAGWFDVTVDGCEIGWRSPAWRTAWPMTSDFALAREVTSGDVEADVRWILGQIPGCADLEIEWVNE